MLTNTVSQYLVISLPFIGFYAKYINKGSKIWVINHLHLSSFFGIIVRDRK